MPNHRGGISPAKSLVLRRMRSCGSPAHKQKISGKLYRGSLRNGSMRAHHIRHRLPSADGPIMSLVRPAFGSGFDARSFENGCKRPRVRNLVVFARIVVSNAEAHTPGIPFFPSPLFLDPATECGITVHNHPGEATSKVFGVDSGCRLPTRFISFGVQLGKPSILVTTWLLWLHLAV